MRIRKFIALTAVVFLITTMAAYAAPNRVIVVFDPEIVNEPAQEALVRAHGGTIVKELPIITGKAVFLPPQALATLAGTAGVVRIDPDVVITAQKRPEPEPEPEPDEVLPWGVDRIDAELAWGGSTGAGVRVAIVDTGIDLEHPDLQVVGNINIIKPRKSGDDDSGHGTHVAGTVAAVNNAIGVVGVAPDANLYAVKVLDRRGNGYLSDIIAGLEWCIDNNVQVINMSLGTLSDIQSFHDAVQAVNTVGIIQVAAAGNEYGGSVIYPAAYEEVIAVSATDDTDSIAGFSSIGPEVELAAPGADILSTAKGGGTAVKSGTSMACPHVTGVVALAISAGIVDPRTALQNAADDLGAPGQDNLYGYGLVDAEETVTGIPMLAPTASARNITPVGKTATIWGKLKSQ